MMLVGALVVTILSQNPDEIPIFGTFMEEEKLFFIVLVYVSKIIKNWYWSYIMKSLRRHTCDVCLFVCFCMCEERISIQIAIPWYPISTL